MKFVHYYPIILNKILLSMNSIIDSEPLIFFLS